MSARSRTTTSTHTSPKPVFPGCAAVLIDIVNSRHSGREHSHRALLAAIEHTNRAHPALEPLRTTVGDEAQGIYDSLGNALAAAITLRLTAATQHNPTDLRVGVGLGDVTVIDAQRGIQDGTAWWHAREAITWVAEQSESPHFTHLRTHVVGAEHPDTSLTNATLQLLDAHLGTVRPGALATLAAHLEGHSNQQSAAVLGISASANSQRMVQHQFRIVAAAIDALHALP